MKLLTNKASLATSALLLVLSIVGCRGDGEAQQSAPPTKFVAVAKGKVDVEGGVIRLAAQREGLIKAVFVEEGDYVRRGQLLAQLDSRQAELGAAQARAELEESKARVLTAEVRLAAAQREAVRAREVSNKNAMPVQEYDRTEDEVLVQQTELRALKAAVKGANERLNSQLFEIEARLIRAPIDGRIVRRSAKPGDGASTTNVTELFLMAPDTSKIVRAELDEQFVSSVKRGQKVSINSDSDSSQNISGIVLRLGEVFGARKLANDDPTERQDMRVIEMVVSIENDRGFRIGQRVQVQVLK